MGFENQPIYICRGSPEEEAQVLKTCKGQFESAPRYLSGEVMFKKLICKHNNITYIGTQTLKSVDQNTTIYETIDIYKCNRCGKKIEKSSKAVKSI